MFSIPMWVFWPLSLSIAAPDVGWLARACQPTQHKTPVWLWQHCRAWQTTYPNFDKDIGRGKVIVFSVETCRLQETNIEKIVQFKEGLGGQLQAWVTLLHNCPRNGNIPNAYCLFLMTITKRLTMGHCWASLLITFSKISLLLGMQGYFIDGATHLTSIALV